MPIILLDLLMLLVFPLSGIGLESVQQLYMIEKVLASVLGRSTEVFVRPFVPTGVRAAGASGRQCLYVLIFMIV